ncbi:MAG: LysR family transcriptional regulator [Cohaesibacter sp.]|nr:LysR family transcriptional regulator [Cohaesibacter sp.]MCV6603496.1 LysR family transcriptional regulator [Cohaesibacter sp.]
MDLRQLEVFEAIMRSGSVSAAAREIGLTQSAVSRILARLEASLGFDLFIRANGRLSATDQANKVLFKAKDILEGVSALQAISSSADSESNDFTFVTLPSLSYTLIPSVLADYSKARPEARIQFDVRTAEAALEAMIRREAEFAIVTLPVSHPMLTVTPLFRTISCAVMRDDHALVENDLVHPTDLRDEKMILLLRRLPTRQLIDDAFMRSGLVPNIHIGTSNVATACRCVSNGLGIAILDGMMASYSSIPNLVIKPFIPNIHHTVALVEPMGHKRSEKTELFIECLISELESKSASLKFPIDII